MKKQRIIAVCLIVALLVVPVVVYSQAVPAVAIWGVTTAGAAWTAASELALTVRAALAAPAFYSAAAWVTSTLAPAASSVAVGMAVTGGLLLAAGWTAYCAYKGWEYLEGHLVAVTPGVPVPAENLVGDDFVGPLPAAWIVKGYGTTWECPGCAAYNWGTYWPIYYPGGSWGLNWAARYNPSNPNEVCIYNPKNPNAVITGEITTELTMADVTDAMDDDLVSTDPVVKAAAQAAALAAVAAVADVFNDAKKNGIWPPPAIPGGNPIPQSQWDAWEDALKAGISDTDKSAMGAQDTTANYGLDASNPPIALVGPLDSGLTEEQVKNAVRDGIEEAEEDLQPPDLPGPPPLGTDPDPPDKLSLTAILEDYTDNLETLPIVGIVSGAHLEIAGADPVLDLPVTIPPNPPVNVRIDFSKYESIVDTLGTLMLTYVSIIWTVWLFKGRGDA